MNLDDKKSKKIAEILGNKTCKKILDYLTDNSEASEKDIADALNITINTTEYNLKKLLETGLIEKTKNFFWSKKGKKIPMYKLAKKHIVISPKSTRPNLIGLQALLPLIAIFAVALILVLLLAPSKIQEETGIQKFKSLDELEKFIEKNKVDSVDSVRYSFGDAMFATSSDAKTATAEAGTGASDFSTTNIQVQGVDEADIVKNDGKYIYAVSGNKVFIVNAYPAEDMEILSEIKLENIGEIFINDDKLVIFTREYSEIAYPDVRCIGVVDFCPQYQESRTSIYIYDVSDKENPELKNKVSVSGNYLNSRMIGDYVYVIANQYIYDDIILPMVLENTEVNVVKPEEISYYPGIRDYNFQFTIILGINIENGEATQEVLLTGNSYNIFVSENNIYTTYTKYSSWYDDAESNEEKTIIHKILIDKDEIEYKSTGEVPGHVLNQFSMDEYDGKFRIATTAGQVWSSDRPSMNALYVLDGDLQVIGELEELAPGESIYSVRFMGERAYVVTFKKVDPLFVIDLSEPTPEILGKLKIPGYSDYLHPYDENHIIGIGKEAVDASIEGDSFVQRDFAWYQGIKMAIFDVTDVNNPVEMHKIVIGDRGTDSDALHDHKAFLFDKEKELLVIPITLAEIQGEKTSDNQYGEQTFQGAYVYKVNLEDGFELQGRISHVTEDEELKSGYYYNWQTRIKRSLFMDDTLYTLSDFRLKANDLADDLKEINLLKLGSDYYVYGGDVVTGIAF